MHEYVRHYVRNLTANKVRPTHVLSSAAKIILQLFMYRVCDVYREFSKMKKLKKLLYNSLSCLVLFTAGKFSSLTFLIISVRGMNSAEYLPKLSIHLFVCEICLKFIIARFVVLLIYMILDL